MKRAAAIFCLLLVSGASWGYITTPQALVSSCGSLDGTSFHTTASFGEGCAGTMSGGPYLTEAGFSSGIQTSSVPTGDAAPIISNLKFDGQTILNNDYVKSNAVITALVTDDASGVNPNTSSLEVDSTYIPFTNSSCSFSGGILTYQGSFGDGPHTFRIYARDGAGNLSSSDIYTFRVSLGEAQIPGAVLNVPNPFNPGIGQRTEICYQLNKEAEVTIYIFNTINQLIKKISCPAGSTGGQAGYNKVPWDGISDFAEVVANDVYFARIVSGGKQLGKCKIAVIK